MTICAACRSFVYLLAGAVAFSSVVTPARATDTEHREFTIFVDGKEAGSSKMTLVQQDDGSCYMSATVDVKFRRIISDYTLKIETQEWWKDGRLIGMRTSGTENGKKTEVVIGADRGQLRLSANGQKRAVSPDIWTTSFWKLADARFHNKQVPVLEVESGKEWSAELKFIDNQKLKIGDQLQECYHFRVIGGSGPTDLWFDRYHRLVRQEFTELGHKTIVQLVNIRR